MTSGGGREEERARNKPAAGVQSEVAASEPRRPVAESAAVATRPSAPATAAADTVGPAVEPAPAGDLWARVMRGPGVTAVLRTILSNLRVKSADVASGRVVIAGDAKYAESARSRQAMIVDALRRELGRGIELIIEANAPDAGDGGPDAPAAGMTPADRPEGEPVCVQPATPEGPPQALSDHPLIREAMELFGARIVDVQHRRPAAPP